MPPLDAADHARLRGRQRDATGLKEGVRTNPLHDLSVPIELLEPLHEFPPPANSKRNTFEDLPGCPGRAVLRRAPRFLTPADLVGTGVQLQGFAVDEAADAVLVAHLEGGGGLISYLGKNGTYTHTLNTEEGLVRKLAQLGLRAEG